MSDVVALTTLGRVLRGLKDGTHGTFSRVAEGYPLLSAKNVRDGWLSLSDAESQISESDFHEIIRNGYPKRGDVLLTIVGTIGRSAVFRQPGPAAFQRSVCFLRPGPLLNADFLAYQLQGNHFQEQLELRAKVSAQPGVYLGDISQCRVYLPDVPTQVSIVNFLDRETGEIDAFIRDQEELVGFLQERRAATISHAVTRGLDPNAPTKSSGVPWLGRVPKHWSVTRLSRFFSITLGKMLDASKEAANHATVLPYVRAANIQETKLDLTSFNEMAFTVAEQRSFSLRRGDLLVVEGGAIGVNQWIREDMPGWAFQKTVNRARSRGQADSRFLGFALDSLRYSGVVDMIANKSTIAHLTAEKLERLVMAWPPPAEQLVIVERLEHDLIELDDSIEDARSSIALSSERRSALISAAVTGKIDVRESAGV